MAQFRDLNFPDTGNLREDMRQYQIELERRLRYILRNLSSENFSLTFSANRLLQSNANGNLDVVNLLSNYITGTAGNLTVTDDGTGGVILAAVPPSGSQVLNVSKINTTTTLLPSAIGVILCDSASAITVNLPTAVSNEGLNYSISNINSGTVTIDANGSQTIQGNLTYTLLQDEAVSIVSDNANWFIYSY